jgi:hypothetical protein
VVEGFVQKLDSSGTRLFFNNRLIGIVLPSADANKTKPFL